MSGVADVDFERIGRTIKHVVARRSMSADLRQDFENDAWVRVLSRMCRFDASRSNLDGYVETIAKYSVLESFRSMDALSQRERKKAKAGTVAAPIHVSLEPWMSVTTEVEASILTTCEIHNLMRALGKRERAVVRELLLDEDLTGIARHLKISLPLACRIRQRAIKRMASVATRHFQLVMPQRVAISVLLNRRCLSSGGKVLATSLGNRVPCTSPPGLMPRRCDSIRADVSPRASIIAPPRKRPGSANDRYQRATGEAASSARWAATRFFHSSEPTLIRIGKG